MQKSSLFLKTEMTLTLVIFPLSPSYQSLIEFFKKMMHDRLKRFLDKNKILIESQYGFREKRSTEHAILDIVRKIQKNLDMSMFSCGVFIDLQKAFDTVDHEILLQKLHHFGIRGIINNWFCSNLSERTHTTQIGPHISNKEKAICGVPVRALS